MTFGVAGIHKVLSSTIYIGEFRFNTNSSRTRQRKPEEEVVKIAVPAIIEVGVYEHVQKQLRARNPRVVAPRVTTGPILLTGLAVCATCRGAMTLRTGTSATGVIHRYYTCCTCARKGKSVCKGRSIRMDKLDALVTDHLVDRLLRPDRLANLLSSIKARCAETADSVSKRIMSLQHEVTTAEHRLMRLYRLVEDGVTELDDILTSRLDSPKAERDRAKAALETTKSQRSAHISIDPALIENFGRRMRENLRTGSTPFRKAYLRSLVDVIEVDDAQIRIRGSKDLLERAVLAGQSIAEQRSQSCTKWRTRQDSNV